MFTTPNPSSTSRRPSREGTHPYTPLKRGFILSPGGLWLGANGSKRRGWG